MSKDRVGRKRTDSGKIKRGGVLTARAPLHVSGQSLVDYVSLLALIAVVAIFSLTSVGQNVHSSLTLTEEGITFQNPSGHGDSAGDGNLPGDAGGAGTPDSESPGGGMSGNTEFY